MNRNDHGRIRGRKGQEIRKRRLARTHGLCEDCETEGRVIAATAVDHIIPLAHGGPDTDENTRNLCDDHHAKRTAEQFNHKVRPEYGLDGWPVPSR